MRLNKLNNHWFSIIEVLIGIFIFSLWLVSIFLIISSSLNLNEYNKNDIIASNLAREQIELFRNIRDSNYKRVYKWNQIDPSSTDYNNVFETGSYYKIENDFSTSTNFPIKIEKIIDFWEWEDELSWRMQDYLLCLDAKNKYVHDCSWSNRKTYFYKYIKIEELKYMSWSQEIIVKDAYKLKSKVIWYKKWYHNTEINTIVSDWRRL